MYKSIYRGKIWKKVPKKFVLWIKCLKTVGLQTRVDDFFRSTQLTLDLTTPVEGARTPLDHDHLLRPIASAATHQIATVHTNGGVVALTTVGALDAEAGIAFAKAGRGFQVDQVFGAGRFVLGIVGFEHEVVPVGKQKMPAVSFEVNFKFFQVTYLLNFLLCCPLCCIELLLTTLFGLDAMLFTVFMLLPDARWPIALSLLPRKLLLTITRDAPSKRSLRLSPTTLKLGSRIQQVLTVHEPDMPWHLHSWRISDWTCCKRKTDNDQLMFACRYHDTFWKHIIMIYKRFMKNYCYWFLLSHNVVYVREENYNNKNKKIKKFIVENSAIHLGLYTRNEQETIQLFMKFMLSSIT
jgi:hypothetical protein